MSLTFFKMDEFTCGCGCGRNEIDPGFVAILDKIRMTYYDRPLIVTSGYRCPEWDEKVGGKGNHPTGSAADLLVSKGMNMYDFMQACFAMGIPRVVVYRGKPHVHVDMVADKPKGVFVL
ncbi:hypothetical protein MNBD_NITROSPINAE03-2037 [hydrothermal vent metagenome]|uniref:Peptidase M15A C-terminal domain-containing protein n=1 Tax=hydrothermal vent metagenome TaxID=652676 RepID=A0A3B1CQ88_9ZZZZ